MKDTIYTIPLTDAFKAEDECPFCYIARKLEQDSISFTLGCSYMEDDIRAVTDQMGFCDTHYKKLYDYGNKLGLALILHTHYQSIYNDLAKALGETKLPSVSFLQKLTKNKSVNNNSSSPVTRVIHNRTSSCYICDRVEKDMERYINTFFYLIVHNPDFKQLFLNSKGFCLPHLSRLIDAAPLHLKEIEKDEFFNASKAMLLESLKRIEGDISWFIDKYDYRNKNAPIKNSHDAIPRGIQKLAGVYVQDEPFKSTN
ncbi:MAG: DUF6062 family protein [Cellulosilyticaceae bacterium]